MNLIRLAKRFPRFSHFRHFSYLTKANLANLERFGKILPMDRVPLAVGGRVDDFDLLLVEAEAEPAAALWCEKDPNSSRGAEDASFWQPANLPSGKENACSSPKLKNKCFFAATLEYSKTYVSFVQMQFSGMRTPRRLD